MNNVDYKDAVTIAQRALNDQDRKKRFVVDEKTSSTHSFGWIFHGVSRKYLATRNVSDGIPGFGPIIVDKKGRVKFYPPITNDAAAAADYAKIWDNRK